MKTQHLVTKTSLIAVLALLTVMLFGLNSPAEPHTSAEVRSGYHLDAEDALIGGGLNTSMGDHWYFNPNLEWVFVEGGDLWSLNADFHRDLPTSGPAFWLGGGPAILVRDSGNPDRGDDADFGLNLLAGVGARTGSVRPFGQMKVTLSDNSSSSLAFGVRF